MIQLLEIAVLIILSMDGVAVRSGPHPGNALVGRVFQGELEIVEVIRGEQGETWAEVKLFDDRTGWIEYIYNSGTMRLDYRRYALSVERSADAIRAGERWGTNPSLCVCPITAGQEN